MFCILVNFFTDINTCFSNTYCLTLKTKQMALKIRRSLYIQYLEIEKSFSEEVYKMFK